MRTTSGSGASASKAGEAAGDTVGTRGPVSTGHGVRDSTPGPTAAVPGCSRRSSSAVAPGSESRAVNSTGPPPTPAAGPPASASGKALPLATYATGTEAGKAAAETAAAVAHRSAPANRVTPLAA